ncbi:MAG: hypothetical protein K0U38_02140 [Epsilonproteobacteria bacterium]|nr:hypothetical protein [Campylobacterota bacterium]
MTKLATILSISFSTLLLIGCGGGNGATNTASSTDDPTNSSNPTGTQQSISIPKEIAMEIPKALKSNATAQTKLSYTTQKEAMGESMGYNQLKSEILQAEMLKQELEINLLLAEQLMPKIQENCQNIPLATTCTIDENELSFTFTDKLIKEINQLTGEELDESINEIKNQDIPLGQVEFTQYDSSETFQYALKLDMTLANKLFETDVISSIQSIKWSQDENHILSFYSFEDSYFKNSMTLNYLKKENGEKEMEMSDNYQENSSEGSFHFKIIDKNDAEEHFEIISSGEDTINFDGEVLKNHFSSTGELSNQGGFLNFLGTFDNAQFKEKEIFDAQGNVISSQYCATDLACDLNDETTWLTLGDENYEIEENFDTNEDFEYISLDIIGGDLLDGQYLLLAPNSEITTMNEIEVWESMVGEIYSFDNEAFGNLNSNIYSNQLDDLIIVYFNILESGETSFEIITTENRPTLTISNNDSFSVDTNETLIPVPIDENLTFPEPPKI